MTAALRLGTQGWNYPGWVGPFYPSGTRREAMLEHYARAFSTVEVDSTFYAIPPAPVVQGWAESVPVDFRFALKVPQQITHEQRLVDCGDVLAKFLERAELLGDRLGPLLVQLPPDFRPTSRARRALDGFLRALPSAFRWAIEFRDQAWVARELLERLAGVGVALALTEGRWIRRRWMLQLAERPTANFGYVRWLGPDRSITDYSRLQVEREEELDEWATAIQSLGSQVREVYGYANNHWQGHSPETTRRLQRRLGLPVVDPAALRDQAELFG